MTSEPSVPTTSIPYASSVVASHARMSPLLARALALTVLEAASGSSSSASSKSSSPLPSWWRTSEAEPPDGSTPAFPGWNGRAIKSYRRRLPRAMSVLPTLGAESSLLPTPSASTYGSSGNGCPGDGRAEYAHKGSLSLDSMARQGRWPTPVSSDSQKGDCPSERARRSPSLVSAVRMFPTPQARDHKGRQVPNRQGGPSLPDAILNSQGMIPTPTAGDANSSGSRNKEGSKANPGLSLTDAVLRKGSSAADRGRTPGSLNPTWVAWLMGFPIYWTLLVEYPAVPRQKARKQAAGKGSKRSGTA